MSLAPEVLAPEVLARFCRPKDRPVPRDKEWLHGVMRLPVRRHAVATDSVTLLVAATADHDWDGAVDAPEVVLAVVGETFAAPATLPVDGAALLAWAEAMSPRERCRGYCEAGLRECDMGHLHPCDRCDGRGEQEPAAAYVSVAGQVVNAVLLKEALRKLAPPAAAAGMGAVGGRTPGLVLAGEPGWRLRLSAVDPTKHDPPVALRGTWAP